MIINAENKIIDPSANAVFIGPTSNPHGVDLSPAFHAPRESKMFKSWRKQDGAFYGSPKWRRR